MARIWNGKVDENGDPIYEQVGVSGYDNNQEIRMANINNIANYRLAQQQNQFNIDMWNRQNEYNSPAHQIELLQEAGLNPLMYNLGDYTATGNIVRSAEMHNEAPNLQPFQKNLWDNIISGANVASDTALGYMNYKLAEEKTAQEISNMKTEQKLTTEQINESKSRYAVNTAQAKVLAQQEQNLQKDFEKTTAEIANLQKEGQLKDKELKWFDELKQVQKDEVLSKIDLNKSGYKVNMEQANKLMAEVQEYLKSGLREGRAPSMLDLMKLGKATENDLLDINKQKGDIDMKERKVKVDGTFVKMSYYEQGVANQIKLGVADVIISNVDARLAEYRQDLAKKIKVRHEKEWIKQGGIPSNVMSGSGNNIYHDQSSKSYYNPLH